MARSPPCVRYDTPPMDKDRVKLLKPRRPAKKGIVQTDEESQRGMGNLWSCLCGVLTSSRKKIVKPLNNKRASLWEGQRDRFSLPYLTHQRKRDSALEIGTRLEPNDRQWINT